jgi:hypothetical protein
MQGFATLAAGVFQIDDESGTHGGSDVTGMGGVLGRADQWMRFGAGYNKLKRKYDFKIFHTKKFKNKGGDFKGWTDERCFALWSELGLLTASALTDCVAIALDNETYASHYRTDQPSGKVRLDSKYGLCFRMCLIYFILAMIKRKYRKKLPKLHIVLEAGHPNSGMHSVFLSKLKNNMSRSVYFRRSP